MNFDPIYISHGEVYWKFWMISWISTKFFIFCIVFFFLFAFPNTRYFNYFLAGQLTFLHVNLCNFLKISFCDILQVSFFFLVILSMISISFFFSWFNFFTISNILFSSLLKLLSLLRLYLSYGPWQSLCIWN